MREEFLTVLRDLQSNIIDEEQAAEMLLSIISFNKNKIPYGEIVAVSPNCWTKKDVDNYTKMALKLPQFNSYD